MIGHYLKDVKKGIDTILTHKGTELENLVTIFSALNIKLINSQKLPHFVLVVMDYYIQLLIRI